MPIGFGSTIGIQAMSGKGERPELPLNEICLRAVNKYINNYDEARSLKESIEKDGLIEPITVNEISVFLKSKDINDLPKDEKEYYENRLNQGFKYFVTTGHRRFRAYCSLALGKDVHTDEEVENFYTAFNEVLENSRKAEQEGRFADINKYCSIKCFIAKDNVAQENARYNRSNLDQRRIQDFEIVDNIIDEMTSNGRLYALLEENKIAKIKSMSDRAVKDTLNRIAPEKTYATIDEARNTLLELDASLFPGYQSTCNQVISDYIQETKSKKISASSIKQARRVLTTLNRDYIKLIYEGYLPYKTSIDLLTIYDKIDKDEIYKQIKDGTFDIKKEKCKYMEKQPKIVSISNSELIEDIVAVKKGKKTIDEVYNKLKSLNLV